MSNFPNCVFWAVQHENSMPCSMNLSQLSGIKLASSPALLIASDTVSCLRELADEVEELHYMMYLISQSVTTARFKGSKHHQYFSRALERITQ